jgi:hypothetical protein
VRRYENPLIEQRVVTAVGLLREVEHKGRK